MKTNILIKGIVQDGKISFPAKIQKTRMDAFYSNIPDGAQVEMFISVSTDKGTNAQLARLHAMIREIANDIGYTFMEVKLIVKRNTGLCFMKDKTEYCKSFADCDRDDLNLCIQECIRIGDEQGIQLR
jgi:hypothetical protein